MKKENKVIEVTLSNDKLKNLLSDLRPDIDFESIITLGKKIVKSVKGAVSSLVSTAAVGKLYREQMNEFFDEEFILEVASTKQEERKTLYNTPRGIPFRVINDKYRGDVRDASSKATVDTAVDTFNVNLNHWIGYMSRDILVSRAEKVRLEGLEVEIETKETQIGEETDHVAKKLLREERKALEDKVTDKKEIITKIIEPVTDATRRKLAESTLIKLVNVLGSMENLTPKMKVLNKAIRANGTEAFGINWEK